MHEYHEGPRLPHVLGRKVMRCGGAQTSLHIPPLVSGCGKLGRVCESTLWIHVQFKGMWGKKKKKNPVCFMKAWFGLKIISILCRLSAYFSEVITKYIMPVGVRCFSIQWRREESRDEGWALACGCGCVIYSRLHKLLLTAATQGNMWVDVANLHCCNLDQKKCF